MKRRMLRVVGLILLSACLGLADKGASPTATTITPAATAAAISSRPQVSLTRLPPEVRLRKLHLVRPDLIQYPILYEVYC
jgi:hypothetical protein